MLIVALTKPFVPTLAPSFPASAASPVSCLHAKLGLSCIQMKSVLAVVTFISLLLHCKSIKRITSDNVCICLNSSQMRGCRGLLHTEHTISLHSQAFFKIKKIKIREFSDGISSPLWVDFTRLTADKSNWISKLCFFAEMWIFSACRSFLNSRRTGLQGGVLSAGENLQQQHENFF